MRANTIKNFIATIGIISATFILAPMTADAKVTKAGDAGPSATYQYDNSTNNLTITGTGKINNWFMRDEFQGSLSAKKPNIVINEGITEIGTHAFDDRIGTISFPRSLEKIGDDAFLGADSRNTSLKVYASDLGAHALAGVYTTDEMEIINATHITRGTFDHRHTGKIKFNKVITIDDEAFYNNSNVTIYLPNSCTSFGEMYNPTNILIYGYRDYTTINDMVYEGGVDYFNYNASHAICDADVEYDTEWYYTGQAITPDVTVVWHLSNRDIILEEGEDYTIRYGVNRAVGNGTITISGAGFYTGSNECRFNIYGNMTSANVMLSQTSYTYDGTAKTPVVEASLYGLPLAEGIDYDLVYTNNTEIGQATVTLVGKDFYKNSISKNFYINKLTTDLSDAEFNLNEAVFSYDGSEKKPQVINASLNGVALVEHTDYEIVYQNNINIGTGYVSIVGINDYTGTASRTFQIIKGEENTYDAGETFISENGNYTVTDAENKEIEFISTNANGGSVVIPATVDVNGEQYTITSVGAKAFYKNTAITSVVIPNTVKSIENYAFYGCTHLTEVTVGNGLEIIGDNAFRKCTKLEKITLPKSIDELGKNAFYGCKKLKKISIKSNEVVDIGANAFKGIPEKCTINVPNKLVAKYRKKLTKKTGYKGQKIK